MAVRDVIRRAVDGHGRDARIPCAGVAQRPDARNVREEQVSVVSQPVAEDDTRRIGGVERLNSAGSAPRGEDGVESGGNDVVIDVVDGGFALGDAVCDARAVKALDDASVVSAVYLPVSRSDIFFIKEKFEGVAFQLFRPICPGGGRRVVRFERGDPVRFKLFAEGFEGGLVIFEQLVAIVGIRPGRLFCVSGDGIFISVADSPVVDGVPHPLFVQAVRIGSARKAAVDLINVTQLIDTHPCHSCSLLGNAFFFAFNILACLRSI